MEIKQIWGGSKGNINDIFYKAMKVLTKPNITAKDALSTCISKVIVASLKAKLKACEGLISQAETEFESKITKGKIHTISKEKVVNGNVSAKELEAVYTGRMVCKSASGRTIYDKLILAPKYKLTTSPSNPEEETLHPYYDNIENVQWLYAQVNHTMPPTVSFFVKPPGSWPDLLKARVLFHFQSFSLAKLYTKEAAVCISDLNQRFSKI